MSEHPSVTDWITAAATGATAIAATIAGFIAWLAFRHDLRNQLPIIEADFQYEAPYWALKLIIRNRLPETIVVTSATIRRPKGSLISTAVWSSMGGIEIKQPTSNRIEIDFDIAPFGSTRVEIPGARMYADAQRVDLYLLVPVKWTSITIVVVDLRISSKSLTLRDKRMVIKRFISAPPAIKIAPSANIPS
jgi:hypothetical protein